MTEGEDAIEHYKKLGYSEEIAIRLADIAISLKNEIDFCEMTKKAKDMIELLKFEKGGWIH